MRDFTDTRHETAKKHVIDYLGLSELNGFRASVEPADCGSIMAGNAMITGTEISADIPTGQKLELSCIPKTGYIFSNWVVTGGQEYDSTLVSRGDTWKYLESWATPAWNWTSLNYDDTSWKNGVAELGYGDGDETTVIEFGGDSQNKMITSWFRRKVIIEDKSLFTRYTVHLLRDDGARVFLNGKEVIRDNMDRWSVSSSSTASEAVNGVGESAFHTYQINPALFTEGENIIAVEIHQSSAGSSDLSFDMDLTATHFKEGTSVTSDERILPLTVNGNTSVVAHLIPDTLAVKGIYINEVLAKNTSGYIDENGEREDWIELYNAGSEAVDLAGLFLSDALPAVKPWQIPSGSPDKTTILPKGFKVFVADSEPAEGVLHAGFKLDKDGDEVALLQVLGKDTTVIDYLKFGSQFENMSRGRYPDGSVVFEFMPVNTPGQANIFVATGVPSVPENSTAGDVTLFPVPTDGHFFVKFNGELQTRGLAVQICIYSVDGSLISKTQHLTSEIIELSLVNRPKGIYIVSISTDGAGYVRKIIVN
jgi:hypothetical protein